MKVAIIITIGFMSVTTMLTFINGLEVAASLRKDLFDMHDAPAY